MNKNAYYTSILEKVGRFYSLAAVRVELCRGIGNAILPLCEQ